MSCVAAGVGEPVPAVHALAGDDEAVAEGCDGSEEGFGGGGQVAAKTGLAVAVEDDEEEGPGVQVDAGVESDVGGRLEGAHGRPPVGGGAKGGDGSPPPSSQARAFMSIQPLQPTGAAVRLLRGVLSLPRPRLLSGLFGEERRLFIVEDTFLIWGIDN